MSDKKKFIKMTRRQFIKDTSMAAVGSTLVLGTAAPVFPENKVEQSSTVVLIRNKDVLDDRGRARYPVVLEMLDTAITRLTGKKEALAAWKTIIKPDDIVGIKTNEWEHLSTPPEVEKALKKRVLDAGVSGDNICIADRQVLSLPFFRKTTALINTRPMRSHHWAGVGSLIKNYVMFVPDLQESPYHDDCCKYLGHVWSYPIVKGKTRLNVLVMLTPQFHSVGPHSFSPKYVWPYYGFLVGFDPVAVDATGVRIIQAKRREFFGDDRPLNPPPKHIFLAGKNHKLGTSDPGKIELIKIGYDKDIFI